MVSMQVAKNEWYYGFPGKARRSSEICRNLMDQASKQQASDQSRSQTQKARSSSSGQCAKGEERELAVAVVVKK